MQLAFQPGDGGEPVGYDYRRSYHVKQSGEEAWSRRLKIRDDEWQELDYGWLDDGAGSNLVGPIVLHNTDPKAGAVLDVSFSPGEPLVALHVRPGMWLACEPAHAPSVRVRSQKGTIEVRLVALPHGGELD